MSLLKEMSRMKRYFMSSYMPVYLTKKIYRSNFGVNPDLHHPITINEKIQYLKLNTYYNNPTITKCCDKYGIRAYLAERGMKNLLPELYGVYEVPEEIPFEKLPRSFVIKCNHGCGFNILCPDKEKLDIENSKKMLKKWMKQDYWKEYGETQYKYIKKKIIVEQFLGDEISTYKFYCFNGEPKVLYISSSDENGKQDFYIDYFDMDWKHMDVQLSGHEHHPDYKSIVKPHNFDEMKHTAYELCKEFPFVRVDLYDVSGRIYISELTFVPTGGFMRLMPEKVLEEWGSWLDLGIE